jgi:bifunctional non-homologous end joining protein LigD
MMELMDIELSNLEKMMYPKIGVKKKDVIKYYIKIAPKILRFLEGRAIVMKRFPDGIDKPGFYEKNAPPNTPQWVETFTRYSKTAKRDINYIVCNNLNTLIWLANMATLEINITLSTTSAYEKPDLILFDIDPEPPANFNDALEVARLLKESLDELHLVSYVKTSGKKGLHVVVPITRRYTFKQTREFARTIGKYLSKKSDLIVSEFSQSRKPGTVFIDYLQNSPGKTMISPYSLRAEENATVSTPLEWRELKKGLSPKKFNIFTVVKRKREPWRNLMENKQTPRGEVRDG